MNIAIKSLVVGGAALLLAACTTYTSERITQAENLTPKGDAFQTALWKGYIEKANAEAAEKHYSAADLWVEKATLAANGEDSVPVIVEPWGIKGADLDELNAARGRLMGALNSGAGNVVPEITADAQVKFDCWVEERSENVQPADIKACKRAFETAMADIADAMKPMPKPVTTAAPAAEPAMPAKPMAITRQVSERFIVYFDFDKSDVTGEGATTIANVVASTKGAKKFLVWIRGHADRAGSPSYNEALADRRAEEVAYGLMDSGIEARAIRMNTFGETDNAVRTADGVRERFNRRVEIIVDKKIEIMPSN